jgi:hypothetical protein
MGINKARKGIPQWLKEIEAIKAPKIQEPANRYADFAIFRKKMNQSLSNEDAFQTPEKPVLSAAPEQDYQKASLSTNEQTDAIQLKLEEPTQPNVVHEKTEIEENVEACEPVENKENIELKRSARYS